jgi:hypothetical protein
MLFRVGMVCLVLWFSALGTSCVVHTPLCLPATPLCVPPRFFHVDGGYVHILFLLAMVSFMGHRRVTRRKVVI